MRLKKVKSCCYGIFNSALKKQVSSTSTSETRDKNVFEPYDNLRKYNINELPNKFILLTLST